MATQVSFDIFIQFIKDLPVSDIQATCASNKAYNTFCRRPNFWSEVIRVSYNIIYEAATVEDYRFLYDLIHLPIGNPNDEYNYGVLLS